MKKYTFETKDLLKYIKEYFRLHESVYFLELYKLTDFKHFRSGICGILVYSKYNESFIKYSGCMCSEI